jgi:hypothetical protein
MVRTAARYGNGLRSGDDDSPEKSLIGCNLLSGNR